MATIGPRMAIVGGALLGGINETAENARVGRDNTCTCTYSVHNKAVVRHVVGRQWPLLCCIIEELAMIVIS